MRFGLVLFATVVLIGAGLLGSCDGTIIASEEEFHHTIPAPSHLDTLSEYKKRARDTSVTARGEFKMVELLGLEDIQMETSERGEYGDFLLNFESPDTPEPCKAAVRRAVDILSGVLVSVDVKISVDVRWVELGRGILASAGPRYIYLNAEDGIFYASAVANQKYGSDLNPNASDILVSINSATPNWFYGVDYTEVMPPGTYDLVTVVLHELLHGLGWIGLVKPDGSYGGDGAHLYKYDEGLVLSETGSQLVGDLPVDESKVKRSFGDDLELRIKDGQRWLVYNPQNFRSGSSLYHLDETAYPDGDGNSLMTPVLKSRQRIHSPGPAALSVLEYIGWDVRDCSHYQSSCDACVLALCYWCGNGLCLPSHTRESSDSGGACYDSCPSCLSDSDCQDHTNVCAIGKCSSDRASCSYSQVDCGNGKYCDSSKGCVSVPTQTPSPTQSSVKSAMQPPVVLDPSLCSPLRGVVQFVASPTGSKNYNSIDSAQLLVPFIPESTDKLQSYKNWYISDVTLTVILDKVDAICLRPSHASVKANELYLQLVVKPSSGASHLNETFTAIAKQTFTQFSTFVGPYNWTFSSDRAVTRSKISIRSPKNGTYQAFQRVDQVFSSSSTGSAALVDNKFGALQWLLVVGDTTLGNPLCFYGARLRVDLVKQLEQASLPSGALCQSTWLLSTTPDMLSVSLAVPENFFSAGSRAFTINSLKLSDCKNKASQKLSLGFKTLVDVLLAQPIPRVYNIPVEVVSFNACTLGSITFVDGNGKKRTSEVNVRIDGFSADPKSSGSLLIDEKEGSFAFSAKLRVSFAFSPSGYLWTDNPPGYVSPWLTIQKKGPWNLETFATTKTL